MIKLKNSCFVLLLPAIMLLMFVREGSAEQFLGKVIAVVDGDVVMVEHLGREEVVRLAGIDSPDRGQPFWRQAKEFTASMVAGLEVKVKIESRDQYGRNVGEIILPDGRSLNRLLVFSGFAWWYRSELDDKILGELEEEAQLGERGLWARPNPMPPWEFRKAHMANR